MPQLPIVGIVPMFWGLDLNSNVDQRLRLPFVGAVWKQATQLEHGLFPPNAALLPRYIGWSQPQMDSVLLLFQGVANLSDDKLGQVFSARARSDLSPAKALWKRAWQCIWKRLDGMNTVTRLMVRNNCHPHQIMERESRITYPSKPPSLGNLHQDIANELFGPELSTIDLGDGEMVISSDVMAIIDRMISIVWHSLSVKTSRMQMESGALHEDILQRFTGIREGLESGRSEKLDMPKIRGFIRAYFSWREKAKLFLTRQHKEEAQTMEVYMETLLHHMGVEGAENKLDLKKVNVESLSLLQSLATPEQRTSLEHYLVELWDKDLCSLRPDDVNELHVANSVESGARASWGAEDLGIEEARQFTLDQLKAKLGLHLGQRDSRQLGFLTTEYDVSRTYTPWDQEHWKAGSAYRSMGNIQPLRLQEQQLDGLYSIYSMFFRPQISPKTGILIADTMGIGKTAQALGFVSMVMSRIAAQKHKNMSLPAGTIYAERLYPVGSTDSNVHCGPHVILSSVSLMQNWMGEIRSWFEPGTVDVFPYCAQTVSMFWADNGPWKTSQLPLEQRIVVVTDSLYKKEYTRLFVKAPSPIRPGMKNVHVWQPSPLRQPGLSTNGTIFSLLPCTFISDEVHVYRKNPGELIPMRERSQFVIGMSGTPLITDPQDLFNIGLLLGIPAFMNVLVTSQQWENQRVATSLQRALSKRRKADLQEAMRSGDFDDINSDETAIRYRSVVHESILDIKKYFQGAIIRRNLESKRRDGTVLVALPPLYQMQVWVKLSKQHETALTGMTAVKTALMAPNEYGRFLIWGRKGTDHAASCSLAASAPIFKSLHDYNENGGMEHCAKWDTALEIIRHDCLRDDMPPCSVNEAGEVQFPSLPASAPEAYTQNRKIAVFMEFKSNAAAFASALCMKLGMGGLVLDGDKDASVRLPIINKWKTGGLVDGMHARVLIFTNVLKAGVNLSAADRLILMNSQWSQQDTDQIIARVHRQPQDKPVYCYHMCTVNSADGFMLNTSKNKALQLRLFTNEVDQEGLESLLLNGSPRVMSDDEGESDVATSLKRKKRLSDSKGKKKTRMSDQESTQADSSEASSKRPIYRKKPIGDKGKIIAVVPSDADDEISTSQDQNMDVDEMNQISVDLMEVDQTTDEAQVRLRDRLSYVGSSSLGAGPSRHGGSGLLGRPSSHVHDAGVGRAPRVTGMTVTRDENGSPPPLPRLPPQSFLKRGDRQGKR